MKHIKYLILMVLIASLSISCNIYMYDDDEKEESSDEQNFIGHAAAGDLESVAYYVVRGVDVNSRDKYSYTALMYASRNGHLNVVEYLLKHDADINAKGNNGNTALIVSSREGHAKVVEFLLTTKKIININTKGYESNTALILASREGHAKVVKLLLAEDKIDVNVKGYSGTTALILASGFNGNIEVVKLLLAEDTIKLEIKNEGGYTALLIASSSNKIEIIKLLLEKGDDINTKDDYGNTVLSQAAFQGDKVFVQYLLSKGALVNAEALTSAIQMHGYLDIVKILVTKNPDVVKEAESYSGATGLMEASYRGHFDIVKYLMDSGSDLNVRDKYGKTALMFLSIYSLSDYMKILKYLVEEKNADISIKDNTGKTALDWAKETKHTDIVNYLESL